VGLKGEAA